jgi:hypothetical protein
MLIFTYNIDKYIRKKILPTLLIMPNKYQIKGSFKKHIPYITDIDVFSQLYPEITDENIYQELVIVLNRVIENPKIIIAAITCGVDDRFRIVTGNDEEIDAIKSLVNPSIASKIDIICQRYADHLGKKIFYINEIIWDYFKIRWSVEEVLANSKTLIGDIRIKFTDFIGKNCLILVQYYVNLDKYPVGIDIVFNYKKIDDEKSYYSAVRDYQIKLANYAREYYYMLFPIRNYFRKDNTIYQEIDDLIEKKYGLYKQLMVRIDSYHMLYKYNKLDYKTASNIVSSILKDIKYLGDPKEENVQMKSNTIALIKRVLQVEDYSQRIREWDTLLGVLYDEINMEVSIKSQKYFYKYLEMLPVELQKKYFLKDKEDIDDKKSFTGLFIFDR